MFYGVVAVGVVRVALRPSEDTQKSCGERESYKKSLNLTNFIVKSLRIIQRFPEGFRIGQVV